MRGRKPSSPKVKDLAKGTLKVVSGKEAGAGEGEAKPKCDTSAKPPAWLKSRHAKAKWKELLPDLRLRKQYIDLFAAELARYCYAYGAYIEAVEAMAKGEGPVTKSSKGVEMVSMHYVVANKMHETMRGLAADLGLNPVSQVRLAGLQLDLFDQPATTGQGKENPFGQFRR
ncbi:MAG: P27 family phage terminase small subunit [Gammaproteobacteria bacterium]|nr:P27 family phage terminase small subunit [Gammaproteobacteria bacterium]